MRLESLFHVSFYVALALAASGLALPTTFFLEWMPYFLGAMLFAYFLAWRHEGRWLLSEAAANYIGVFIALASGGWILLQVPRSHEEVVAGGVNWPAGLLPHLGPLLMVLLAVKLFRPKRLPDFWVIQTMGLMMVALAAVLADEQSFGGLLVLYLGSLIWSLALYYPVRERALLRNAKDASPTPLFDLSRQRSGPAPLGRGCGLFRLVGWTMTVAALGFVLFMAAPRQGQSQWNARQLSVNAQGGIRLNDEAGLDLNRTGHVELSDEPAFSFAVRDAQGRLQEPTLISRWRLEVLEVYLDGCWFPQPQRTEPGSRRYVEPLSVRGMPVSLADNERIITFHVKPDVAGGLPLAEPADSRQIGLDPRIDQVPQSDGFFAQVRGSDSLLPLLKSRRRTYSYAQLMRVPIEDSERPAEAVHENYLAFLNAQRLNSQQVPRPLANWARELLARLSERAGTEQIPAKLPLDSAVHATVARAFCRHLSSSGEYRYSLELRRKDRGIDVTADFLLNVKEGHCERFAGALALMLRAVGIRCRVVKGYLGADSDDEGQGVVRLSQAHTWVEALVPAAEGGTWKWLTLDPTPATATQAGALVSWWRWLYENLSDVKTFWRHMVLEYSPDQQTAIRDMLKDMVLSQKGLIAATILAGGVVLLGVGRRRGAIIWTLLPWWKRTGSNVATGVAFYDAFLRSLRRHARLTPLPAQTPREFAAQAMAFLQELGAPGEMPQTPERVTARYYGLRYGGQQIDAAESAEINRRLAEMCDFLRTS